MHVCARAELHALPCCLPAIAGLIQQVQLPLNVCPARFRVLLIPPASSKLDLCDYSRAHHSHCSAGLLYKGADPKMLAIRDRQGASLHVRPRVQGGVAWGGAGWAGLFACLQGCSNKVQHVHAGVRHQPKQSAGNSKISPYVLLHSHLRLLQPQAVQAPP